MSYIEPPDTSVKILLQSKDCALLQYIESQIVIQMRSFLKVEFLHCNFTYGYLNIPNYNISNIANIDHVRYVVYIEHVKKYENFIKVGFNLEPLPAN